jgi:hypothetical protein
MHLVAAVRIRWRGVEDQIGSAQQVRTQEKAAFEVLKHEAAPAEPLRDGVVHKRGRQPSRKLKKSTESRNQASQHGAAPAFSFVYRAWTQPATCRFASHALGPTRPTIRINNSEGAKRQIGAFPKLTVQNAMARDKGCEQAEPAPKERLAPEQACHGFDAPVNP